MDDLFNDLRNKMHDPSDEVPSDAAWNKFLSHRAKKDNPSSKMAFWPLLAAASIILLLLTNGYWLYNDSNEFAFTNNTTSTDTIYITKYIDRSKNPSSDLAGDATLNLLEEKIQKLQKDNLVFENQIKRQNDVINEMQLVSYRAESRLNELSSPKSISDLVYNDKEYAVTDETEQLFEKGVKDSISSKHNLMLKAYDDLAKLDINTIDYEIKQPMVVSGFIPHKSKRAPQFLDNLLPKTLSINGNIGYFSRLKEDAAQGLSTNIRATSIFTKNVRGYVGLAYRRAISQLDEAIVDATVPYPQLMDGDRLKYTVVADAESSIHGGLEYLVNISSKWRPYVGLGFGRVFHHTKHYRFEIDSSRGVEYAISPEHGIKQKGYNQWLVSLGTDLNLARNVDMRLGLAYLQATDFRSTSDLGFEAGFYFHL